MGQDLKSVLVDFRILKLCMCACVLETLNFMSPFWWIILKMQGLYVWMVTKYWQRLKKQRPSIYRILFLRSKREVGYFGNRVWAILMWHWKSYKRRAWVVQTIRHLTLDFGSGHDLRVMRSSPVSSSVLSAVCLRFPLSLSLCLSPHSLTLFLCK